MLITHPCVVSLTWRLQDTQGQLIDELKEPVEFFYGGDDLLAKVEEALADQTVGFEAALHLEPEHAFGEYDPASDSVKVSELRLSRLQKDQLAQVLKPISLNLRLGQTYVVGATRSAESQRALIVVLVAHR